MNIGIVGNEAAKFTTVTREAAKRLIQEILSVEDAVLVSGRCPLGGIDVWAEEEADIRVLPKIIHAPEVESWEGRYGFRARNIDIAKDSDVVHVITVSELPAGFAGMRFEYCYHCAKAGRDSRGHVKSGACWTLNVALSRAKKGFIHIIAPDGSVRTIEV